MEHEEFTVLAHVSPFERLVEGDGIAAQEAPGPNRVAAAGDALTDAIGIGMRLPDGLDGDGAGGAVIEKADGTGRTQPLVGGVVVVDGPGAITRHRWRPLLWWERPPRVKDSNW